MGRSSTQILVERDVEAPAATVWDVVTDLDASSDVMSGIDRIERLDDGDEFAVGARWRETRTMFGRQATEELEVTAFDRAGRSYTVEADSRGAHYRSTLAVDERDDGSSRVRMTFDAEPDGALSRVLASTIGRLFQGATRKALAQDLDDIAAAAERRAS